MYCFWYICTSLKTRFMMETNIIMGKEGSGKTDALIRISHETRQYIVCRASRVHAIVERSRMLKTPIPFPLMYSEFINKQYYGKGIKGFLIDDIDALLHEMTRGVPVTHVTMRGNPLPPVGNEVDALTNMMLAGELKGMPDGSGALLASLLDKLNHLAQ